MSIESLQEYLESFMTFEVEGPFAQPMPQRQKRLGCPLSQEIQLEKGFLRPLSRLHTTSILIAMVVVKRVRSRPGLITRHASDSLAHIRTTPDDKDKLPYHKASPTVWFAHDYAEFPDRVIEPPPSLTLEEFHAAFYTKEEINRFDKDRALTALMYRTRKSNGVAWDDNVHSLRGLEEILQNQRKTDKTKRERRKELISAILKEQQRLKTESGQHDLAVAALSIKKTTSDLQNELIRGISCSMSKIDKQRAIGLAQKDEKAAGRHRTSSRRMLLALKTKISNWVSTSNGSLAGSLAGSENGNPASDDNGSYHTVG